jgi:hypothetical protein
MNRRTTNFDSDEPYAWNPRRTESADDRVPAHRTPPTDGRDIDIPTDPGDDRTKGAVA